MGIGVAIAGLVLAAGGAVVQHGAAKDAAKAQEEQENAAAAVTKQQQIDARRADFRKRRIAAARIAQSAETTGTGDSSALAGAVGSLATQGAAFRGSITATQKAGEVSARARADQREAGIEGTIGSGISSIGMSIFQGAGGFSVFQSPSAPISTGKPVFVAPTK